MSVQVPATETGLITRIARFSPPRRYLPVLAVGMTFVILTGGIDLSVGSNVALSTLIAARTLELGLPVVAVIAVVLLAGTLLGTAMGLLIHYFDIQPFIATLAGMFLARGLCYLISVDSIPIKDETFSAIAFGSITLPGGYYLGWTAVFALVIVAIAAYVLASTRFGRTVYALGGSEPSALLMGLPVAATKVGVYAISGLCAALGGLLFALYTLSGCSLHAVGMELDAIAAVVIGGTLLTGGRGFVVGSLLGVLVLGTIQTFISFDGTLSSWWTRMLCFWGWCLPPTLAWRVFSAASGVKDGLRPPADAGRLRRSLTPAVAENFGWLSGRRQGFGAGKWVGHGLGI
ncbi:sugar ABC transporter permease YjfF [Nocardioides sp. NPDC047086]|uniref:ABC transporter permease subunit n=1 Tax=Nocardioides sp. NPDC047086 TaxID=3154810 RepID=UPI00340B0ED5